MAKKKKFNESQVILKIERAKVAKFINQLFDILERLVMISTTPGVSNAHRYVVNSLVIESSLYLKALTAMLSNATMANTGKAIVFLDINQNILLDLQDHLADIEALEEIGLSVETH